MQARGADECADQPSVFRRWGRCTAPTVLQHFFEIGGIDRIPQTVGCERLAAAEPGGQAQATTYSFCIAQRAAAARVETPIFA